MIDTYGIYHSGYPITTKNARYGFDVSSCYKKTKTKIKIMLCDLSPYPALTKP